MERYTETKIRRAVLEVMEDRNSKGGKGREENRGNKKGRKENLVKL